MNVVNECKSYSVLKSIKIETVDTETCFSESETLTGGGMPKSKLTCSMKKARRRWTNYLHTRSSQFTV